jgi:bile acid:Na+ symporter, BASS family
MNIDQLISLLASITLFEMMVSIGLGVTFADVLGVARNGLLITKAALANYVGVPAVALGLLLWFAPPPLVAAGFLIAAVCPGAPYGPPLTGLAKGNVVVSVGLMVILAGSSAILAPVLLHVLLPFTSGDEAMQVDVVKMITTLLITQFLPLCLGLAARQWRPALASRLQRPANLLSAVLNLTLLSVVIVVQREMLLGIPLRAFFGMFALVFAGVLAGWLLGGPGARERTAMVMATSVRNVGVALVIATASFPGTPAVTAATAFAIFQTIVMALTAVIWGRLKSAQAPDAREDPAAAQVIEPATTTGGG